MNTQEAMPTMNTCNLLNYLIENKCINLKKTYKLKKEIIDNSDIIVIENYCKNRTNKGNLCLNKCTDNSKHCKIHDPIMKEQKIINRINRINRIKLWQKENSLMRNIEYDIDFNYLPSAPLLEDIKEDLPVYEQKPDECGLTIKNTISNKGYHLELNQSMVDTLATQIENIKSHSLSYYKEVFIKEGDVKSSKEIRPISIIESRNQVLLRIDNVVDSRNNIFPVIEKLLPIDNGKSIISIDEYKNKLNSIDFNSINNRYKGLNLTKLYTNTINFEMRLLYCGNDRPFNSKIITYINKFIKKIPK